MTTVDVARQQNALHIAASTNCTNTNVINFILGNVPSGSINMKNRWGNTPLDMAKLFNSNINAVEILKSNGGKTKEEINEDSDSECSKDSHYNSICYFRHQITMGSCPHIITCK